MRRLMWAAHITACCPALQTGAKLLLNCFSASPGLLQNIYWLARRSCRWPPELCRAVCRSNRRGMRAGGLGEGRAHAPRRTDRMRCPMSRPPWPSMQARRVPAGGAGGPAGRAAGGRAGALPAGAVERGPRAAARPALHGRWAGPAPRARRRWRAQPACGCGRLQRRCACPSRWAPLLSLRHRTRVGAILSLSVCSDSVLITATVHPPSPVCWCPAQHAWSCHVWVSAG
jgi:hypothetical protein